MQNEQLILNRLMEIQEDIGSIKTKQDVFEKQMDCLDITLDSLEKNVASQAFMQISKKQVTLIAGAIGSVFITICSWLGISAGTH